MRHYLTKEWAAKLKEPHWADLVDSEIARIKRAIAVRQQALSEYYMVKYGSPLPPEDDWNK